MKRPTPIQFAASVFLLLSLRIAVQSQIEPPSVGATRPSFEVASVKPREPSLLPGGGPVDIGTHPGGLFTATNASLRLLIKAAYRIQDSQISGEPGWVDSDRFDIEAKTGNNGPNSQIPLMLQTLLEDRFQLKFHHVTKEMTTYNGSKLQQVADDGTGPGGSGSVTISRGPQKSQISLTKRPIANLTMILSDMLGSTVIDKTNLQGFFNIQLEWTTDESLEPNGASIFTAIQEQLGLKLESQKAPVDILVIDSVAKLKEFR